MRRRYYIVAVCLLVMSFLLTACGGKEKDKKVIHIQIAYIKIMFQYSISTSILSIPCGVLYIPIPVSCILMMIQYWINTKQELKDLDKNTNEKMDKNINKNTNKNIKEEV